MRFSQCSQQRPAFCPAFFPLWGWRSWYETTPATREILRLDYGMLPLAHSASSWMT